VAVSKESRTFRSRLSGFARNEPSWLVRDGLLALVIGSLLFLVQGQADEARSSREQGLEASRNAQAIRLENLRFVRDRSEEHYLTSHELLKRIPYFGRPFSGFDLQGQNLRGLILYDADFTESDLRGADFTYAILSGANFQGAHLQGAKLYAADLSDAILIDTDVASAQLTDSHGNGPCYGDGTLWPRGFKPPPSRCPAGGA
jgi:hypothetical protein